MFPLYVSCSAFSVHSLSGKAKGQRIKMIQYSYTPVISGKGNETEVCSIVFYANYLGVWQASILPTTHQEKAGAGCNLLVTAQVCTF